MLDCKSSIKQTARHCRLPSHDLMVLSFQPKAPDTFSKSLLGSLLFGCAAAGHFGRVAMILMRLSHSFCSRYCISNHQIISPASKNLSSRRCGRQMLQGSTYSLHLMLQFVPSSAKVLTYSLFWIMIFNSLILPRSEMIKAWYSCSISTGVVSPSIVGEEWKIHVNVA